MPGTPQTIAVIGAGHRGRSFAFRCLEAGFGVVLEDVLSSNLRRAESELAQCAPDLRDRLQFASSVEDAVREADIAIDFVPDELESKLEIFSMVDRMAPPRTILCTPTLLSITDLASCTYRPDRCIAVMPLHDDLSSPVQIVRGTASSDDTFLEVQHWFGAMGFSIEVRRDTAPEALVRS